MCSYLWRQGIRKIDIFFEGFEITDQNLENPNVKSTILAESMLTLEIDSENLAQYLKDWHF